MIFFGSHLLIAKVHVKRHIRFGQPGMFFNPVIFLRVLQFILKYLLEKTEMIIQADSFPRQPQCCNRIEKTSCQTAKAAIAQ